MIFELIQIILFFFIIKEIQILKQMILKNNIKSSISNEFMDTNILNNFTSVFKSMEKDLLNSLNILSKNDNKMISVD